MTSRHSRMPSDVDRDHPLPPTGLSRATPIMPLGMPSMTKEAKESKEQAAAWEVSLNRILQTMHGDDTARLLAYFKARIEIEDTYSRGLEKLASLQVNSRASKATNNTTNARDGEKGAGGNGSSGGQGNNSSAEPDDIPTTLHQAFEALSDMTLQASRSRRPFIRLIKNVAGALAGLKESHEKQRKIQKENTKPVFQLYAEQRLVTVPRAKRNYEQRCRDFEQVLSIEDSDHLPVRERLKNLASTSGAAGRLVKSKRDMEDADGEYKTAVENLEVFRLQRELRFDTAFKTMQHMIEERGMRCRQCLEAYVNGERELIARMTEDIDRFSVVTNCVKPAGDKEQLSLLFTKDINSHPKPVLYESLYKAAPESIFGMSLQRYVDKHRHPIPLVIVKCSEAIDRAGLNREGIYRVSGRHAQIMNLKRMFDTDEDGVDLTNPPLSEDCTSIAAVLKIYLRELPQPLFPFALNERIAYSTITDRNVRLGELKVRLKALPGCNIDTLQFLIEHLRRIYDHVETNKMTLDNLSMIFTPAIFHDFNSAMVPGAQQQGTQQGNNNQSGGGGPAALSFAASHASLSTSSPSSPSPNAAPWNSYPFPPAAAGDQAPKAGQQQQPQFYPQNQTLGFNHNSGSGAPGAVGGAAAAATGRTSPMPTAALEGSSSAYSLPLPQQSPQSQPYGVSPQYSGMMAASTSPPTGGIGGGGSGFTASAATTTSTAASWSNDLVLSDLILNSMSVFNVLPKLPARTNSVYSTAGWSTYSNDDRHLSVTMSGTTLSDGVGAGPGGPGSIGNNGISTARPFSNSRKSSASSLGVPSSPIDGSGQLRPRMDSLPNITATAAVTRSIRESEPSPPPPQQRQVVQQQQQQQYQYHQSPKQQPQQQYQQQQQQPYQQQQQQQQQQYQLPTPQPQQQGYTEQRQNPPSRRPQPTYDSQQQQ